MWWTQWRPSSCWTQQWAQLQEAAEGRMEEAFPLCPGRRLDQVPNMEEGVGREKTPRR